MKLKQAPDKYEIQVGDTIRIDTRLSVKDYKVSCVTKTYAFIKYNDRAEGKFKRIYSMYIFKSLPHQKLDTNSYTVLIEDK